MNLHLVVYLSRNETFTMVQNFKHVPPTISDIIEMQQMTQKEQYLLDMPVIVNWLPIQADDSEICKELERTMLKRKPVNQER